MSKKRNRKKKGITIPRVVKTGSPKLVKLMCSGCGAVLNQIDETHAECPHCGAKYLIDQPENLEVHIHIGGGKHSENSKTTQISKTGKASPNDHSAKTRSSHTSYSRSHRSDSAVYGWTIAFIAILALFFVIILPKNTDAPKSTPKNNSQKTTEQSRKDLQDTVIARFCEELLGKSFPKLTDDLEQIKYISYRKGKKTAGDTWQYTIHYSLTDYRDCESIQAFLDTIETWVYESETSISSGDGNFQMFCGLTAVRFEDKTFHFSEKADITLLWLENLQDLKKESITDHFSKDQIKALYIDAQNQEDISVLGEYPNLEYLKIHGSSIKQMIPDLSCLANCPRLKSLDLDHMGDAHIGLAALKHLSDMEYLCIDKLSLDNAEFLLNMPNLKHLVLKSGSGEHLSYLKNLSRIEQLELSGNPIAVSELPEMPFLWNLNCELAAQTELDDLTRFPSLTCLTANLSLLNNGPVDVAPMGQLMQLEELHIAGFMDLNIKGVEAVLNLPKLRELSIRCSTYGYRSVMLDPALLKEECSLEKLFLKRCQFVNLQTSETDWTCFSHLTNLRDATLFLCKLEDICFLSGLPKLEILDLEKNSISDFSPLLQCPALKTVYTWGNPQLEPQLPKTVEIIPHETLDDFFS